MEVWIVLIYLLEDIKECSSDALYGMEILLLTSKPKQLCLERNHSSTRPHLGEIPIDHKPSAPTTDCLSILKPAISAVFLSPLRMGLELFRKSEYIATLLLIYLFAMNSFCFAYAAKQEPFPDLARFQR